MFTCGAVTTKRLTEIAFLGLGPDDPDAGRSPVVLVHPINLRKECWLDVVRVLGTRHHCVAPDLAGHGESGDVLDPGLAAWVADCRDVVEALDLPPFHLVGGSLGGTIALCLAAELPGRVLSVTAIGSSLGGAREGGAPPADVSGAAATAAELFARLVPQALAPGASAERLTTVARLTNTHGLPVVERILAAAETADATPWAPGVQCPTLVLTGAADTTCPPAEGERMAWAVGGRHVVLPGVGHLPMLEAAGAVLDELLPHLDAAEFELTELVRAEPRTSP